MKLPINLPTSVKASRIFPIARTAFWFLLGATLGLFFFSSFIYIYYKQTYANKIYPGVFIGNKDFGGKTKDDVIKYFNSENRRIQNHKIEFIAGDIIATTSAKDLEAGYDSEFLASQAYSIGHSGNFFTDIYLSLESYLHGISLSPMYHHSDKELARIMDEFKKQINVAPIDARFTYQNGRVTEFTTAKNGKSVDVNAVENFMREKSVPLLFRDTKLVVAVPVQIIEPDVETNEANKMGITERIGVGTSLFRGSIPNRVFNLTLASTRLNGVLIKPGEVFSFNKALGDVSAFTGYKQAYVISGGRTILGDGGGVCQVSTTFFRALLNAGLPIVERNPHAYRVSYYEQDMGPGVDAAIYTPNVDLKFKNDTGKHILIQTYVDEANAQLTFELYGTSDGRVASVSAPVILSQTPAPEPLYQDDPELPKDTIKQIDWAASGAVVYFDYHVTRNGKDLIKERFTTRYRPWQAVYLRGTKEG